MPVHQDLLTYLDADAPTSISTPEETKAFHQAIANDYQHIGRCLVSYHGNNFRVRGLKSRLPNFLYKAFIHELAHKITENQASKITGRATEEIMRVTKMPQDIASLMAGLAEKPPKTIDKLMQEAFEETIDSNQQKIKRRRAGCIALGAIGAFILTGPLIIIIGFSLYASLISVIPVAAAIPLIILMGFLLPPVGMFAIIKSIDKSKTTDLLIKAPSPPPPTPRAKTTPASQRELKPGAHAPTQAQKKGKLDQDPDNTNTLASSSTHSSH